MSKTPDAVASLRRPSEPTPSPRTRNEGHDIHTESKRINPRSRSHTCLPAVCIDDAAVRVDASVTAIAVVVIFVFVVIAHRECKANWYRDISQRLPPLSANCALAVVYLWPGYYRRPAIQGILKWVCRVLASRRAAAPLC